MKTKKIELLVSPPAPHYVGDGFRVHNFIPGVAPLRMERMTPFIMLDYNSKFHFSPSEQPRGVDVHPHRGFETVTIAYKGRVAHHDSAGNSGVIGEGDVQWMTAASGVLHKEYHEEQFSKMGGDFQMVQLWVNLPAKDKMSAPKYQEIVNGDIPKVAFEGGYVEVIAGAHKGVAGKASTFTPVNLLNAYLENGATERFVFPENYNTFLLVIAGNITVNEEEVVAQDRLLLFANEGEEFSIKANESSVVLLLSAEPINEPIAAHGPFVMNTRHELVEAFEDFQNGKFGTLK